MTARIGYFVHGRGRGHASRTLQVLATLREAGFAPRVFAAGHALELLRDQPDVHEVPLCAPGGGMARAWLGRVRGDVARLRAMGADRVVSDGDGPSVHAALRLGLTSIAVGHGLVFGHCELPASLPRAARLRERLNAASSSWPCETRVAVHFAPLRARTAGTWVARPDLPAGLRKRAPEDFLVAYFRDGNGSAELQQLVQRGHRVVCFGRPQRPVAGVDYQPPSSRGFADTLARARGVVGSAGNHLPAECAMLGVPMLGLYRADDAEHRMNAALLEHAGIGLGLPFGALDVNALRQFEARLGRVDETLVRRTRALPSASEVLARLLRPGGSQVCAWAR